MNEQRCTAFRYRELDGDAMGTLIRFAHLRGLADRFCDLSDEEGARAIPDGTRLIAISGRGLDSLQPVLARRLKNLVHGGAVLYVRGGFVNGRSYSLAPLAEGVFVVTSTPAPGAYRFTADALVPPALANESLDDPVVLPGAEGLDGAVRPLLIAVTPQGHERPVIFAVNAGGGMVIYDLQADDDPSVMAQVPLVQRLAEPCSRLADAGALMAANWAAGYREQAPVAWDLVLDDRPRSFDWLRNRVTLDWLTHMKGVCGDLHVDFAWTPSQTYVGRGYLDILKRFDTGFVWHGFLRHIDHRWIPDLDDALVRGKRMVDALCKRYGVRFQHIMVFPFERASPEAIRILKRAGFVASAETAYSQWGTESHLPPYLRHATPLQTLYSGFFPVLRRYTIDWLTRERMLALGALDLPIIATAHPQDFGLRMLSGLRDDGTRERCDQVLRFAADKKLRARSLEQIACEAIDQL